MDTHILKRFATQLSFALTAPMVLAGIAQAGQINTGYFGNVAIEGYDAVAYFTDGKAVKGSDEYAYDWLGASWHFASAEHRKLFAANPISYAPQYGGLCAEGVAFDQLNVNVEPEVWQIIDGKLYLSSGAGFGDMPGHRAQADANWATVRDELTQ